ncbi:MAG: hypothetical protein ACUVTM_04135 [Candidatus Bathyarchaeia archaeon]
MRCLWEVHIILLGMVFIVLGGGKPKTHGQIVKATGLGESASGSTYQRDYK